MIRVQVRPNEPLEAALRRFKRQCNYAGIFRLAKKHAYHEKSSDKKRREDRERLRNIMMAERKRGGGPTSGRSKKRPVRRGRSNDRRGNDQPDFDPLTADTTIQKADGTKVEAATVVAANRAAAAKAEAEAAAAAAPAAGGAEPASESAKTVS